MESTKQPIDFKPLSEGLGFHPFADGLPYAPVVKQVQKKELPTPAALNSENLSPLGQLPMGTGAMAAGRPAPVMPGRGPIAAPPRAATPPARVNVPVATASVGGIPSVQASAQTQTLKSALVQAATRVSATPDHVRAGQTLSNTDFDLPVRFGFVYLLKRVFAFSIDALVNTTLCFLALGAVMVRLELSWEAFSNLNLLLLGILFLAMFNWSIMTAQEVLLGTTLGKRMFGLVLRGDTSALFLRAFFFLPSMVFGGLGIVWAIFDRRRRCWHDHAVDVQPLELAQL